MTESTNENEGFLEKRVKSEKWSAWSLRHGMEQLSRALTSAVTLNPLCEIRTDSACLALIPASDGRIKVRFKKILLEITGQIMTFTSTFL